MAAASESVFNGLCTDEDEYSNLLSSLTTENSRLALEYLIMAKTSVVWDAFADLEESEKDPASLYGHAIHLLQASEAPDPDDRLFPAVSRAMGMYIFPKISVDVPSTVMLLKVGCKNTMSIGNDGKQSEKVMCDFACGFLLEKDLDIDNRRRMMQYCSDIWTLMITNGGRLNSANRTSGFCTGAMTDYISYVFGGSCSVNEAKERRLQYRSNQLSKGYSPVIEGHMLKLKRGMIFPGCVVPIDSTIRGRIGSSAVFEICFAHSPVSVESKMCDLLYANIKDSGGYNIQSS